ncbi:MAG: helix-turn-helix domain-containing protein [Limnochordia bacterium]
MVVVLVGQNVRRLREKKGLTQAALAKDAGLAQSFVSSIESGQKSPTVRSLQKLANALDVPLNELLVQVECLEKDPLNGREGGKN